MGLRSLIEINHDSTQRLESDPAKFVDDLLSYVRSNSSHFAEQLYGKYDTRVVGLRHSSDVYYIPASAIGFPSKLPWDDFEKERAAALVKAKNLTDGDRRTKRGLEEIIHRLVAIVERQQETLDDN